MARITRRDPDLATLFAFVVAFVGLRDPSAFLQ